MILVVMIWILMLPLVSLIIMADFDTILSALLILPLLCVFTSSVESALHNQEIKWEKLKKKKDWIKPGFGWHNKSGLSSVNYIAFTFKLIIYLTEIWGFYQWFDKMYSHMVFAVLHAVLVAAVLGYNLYVDTFEGNWYRGLNIKIIKDEFVQRKAITMIFLILFVALNAFAVYI